MKTKYKNIFKKKRAQIHAGGIVREIECWYCIALLNDAKMNLNDTNRNSVPLKKNHGNDTAQKSLEYERVSVNLSDVLMKMTGKTYILTLKFILITLNKHN